MLAFMKLSIMTSRINKLFNQKAATNLAIWTIKSQISTKSEQDFPFNTSFLLKSNLAFEMREANRVEKLFTQHMREVLLPDHDAKMELYEKVELLQEAIDSKKKAQAVNKKNQEYWLAFYTELVDSV